MAGRPERHGAISDSAKKRAEAAKQYIENMYTDRSKIMNEKKDRCVRMHVVMGPCEAWPMRIPASAPVQPLRCVTADA